MKRGARYRLLVERCCQCHRPMTEDEIHYYGHSCNDCEIDYTMSEGTNEIKSWVCIGRRIYHYLRRLRHYFAWRRDVRM